MRSSLVLLLLVGIAVCPLAAQQRNEANLAAIVERLERLEQQNKALAAEVESLKQQLAAAKPAAVEERLDVQERRTEELAQSKVEASQRLPISITGMLLFNSYMNSRHNGAQENPTVASLNAVPRTAGATVRQTVLGLRFRSPTTVLGAAVNGSLYMDFFANPGVQPTERAISNNLSRLMRLRLATVELDWGSTRLLLGQDKPIISPREPNSLAHVGVSPLTNAGNPWLWQPQARLEQQWDLNPRTNLLAQVGVFQTVEGGGALVGDVINATVESSRPGLQSRVSLRHTLANEGYIEIGPSVHASSTHVAGTSVASRLYSIDWSIAPIARLAFTGMYYQGQNTSPLGTIRQGFVVLGPRNIVAVRSHGGWAQLSFEASPRLTFNIFGGQHDDRNRELPVGAIGKNFAYAGNAQYRIAPNVILGLETMQVRTTYLGSGTRRNNHYDLALAYQF